MGTCASVAAPASPASHKALYEATDDESESDPRFGDTQSDGTLAYETPVLTKLRVKASNVKSYISHGITSDVDQFANDADEQVHELTAAQERVIDRWVDEGIQNVLRGYFLRAAAERSELPQGPCQVPSCSDEDPLTEPLTLIGRSSVSHSEDEWNPGACECGLLPLLHTTAIVTVVNDFCTRKATSVERRSHVVCSLTGEPLTIESSIGCFLVSSIPAEMTKEPLCVEYDTFVLSPPAPEASAQLHCSSETDPHHPRTETGSSVAEGSTSSGNIAPYAAHGNPWLDRPLTDEVMRVHNKYISHLERSQLELEKRYRPCSLVRLVFGLPGSAASGWM
jgi:hypothetical protein